MATYPERKISVLKYLSVFAIAALLFIAGLLFGQFVTNAKYTSIKTINQDLVFELQDIEVQANLAEDFPCNNYALYSLGDKIDELGAQITTLENQLGKNNPKILELKRPYNLLLIKHYLMIKDRIARCGESYKIALFFYSNKPENVDASEKQGYVLTYFSNKYGYENIKVYSIDADLDLSSVRTLESFYNVSVMPTTVIGDKVFVGFHEIDDFKGYLN